MPDDKRTDKPDANPSRPRPQDEKSTARPLTPEELKDVAGGAFRMQEQKQK